VRRGGVGQIRHGQARGPYCSYAQGQRHSFARHDRRAHGGTIRAALALDLEAALAFTIENCSFTRVDRIDGPSAWVTAGASSE